MLRPPRSLQESIELHQQAFQDYKESREKKIAELIRINQNLERMLRGGIEVTEEEEEGEGPAEQDRGEESSLAAIPVAWHCDSLSLQIDYNHQ